MTHFQLQVSKKKSFLCGSPILIQTWRNIIKICVPSLLLLLWTPLKLDAVCLGNQTIAGIQKQIDLLCGLCYYLSYK